MPNFPPIPESVKHIAHYLKVADEHDSRNIVVSYWSRMYACQVAMKSIPGNKPPEVTKLLIAIMDWLEQCKKGNVDVEGIANDTCGHALIEEYAIQLFTHADAQDRAQNFGKNVVKAFYTAGILMDILQQFGTLNEDIFGKRKYAKWKAAYIHNCLKNGEEPIPGPPYERDLLGDSDDDEEEEEGDDNTNVNNGINPTVPAVQPYPPFPINPGEVAFPSVPAASLPIDPEPNLPSVPEPTLPSPPIPAPQPIPTPQPTPAPRSNPISPTISDAVATNLDAEKIQKAQKYIKWAGSALTYDDAKTAIGNLQKALHLLQYGEEL